MIENKKPNKGIAVDAWCEGNPGKGGYKAVNIETNEILFVRDLEYTTNNIAEFMAIVHSMKWCKDRNIQTTIWSDSMTGLAWVKHKKTKTNIDWSKNPELKKKVIFCENYLISNNVMETKKWETKLWGEIPADFGQKK